MCRMFQSRLLALIKAAVLSSCVSSPDPVRFLYRVLLCPVDSAVKIKMEDH
jgi:hypothetical protein